MIFSDNFMVSGYVTYMNQSEDIQPTSDYKFTFRQTGSALCSERHFSAPNPEVALQMFQFACRKDEVTADEVGVTVWNRWANRWDEISSEDSAD